MNLDAPQLPLPTASSLPPVGFVAEGDRELWIRRAEADELFVVRPAPMAHDQRGQLAALLDEAVEHTLRLRGACPPGVGPISDLASTLGDQLYRARLLGARGLFVVLPVLSRLATLSSVLDGEDSAALRWWIRATRDRPIHLLFDEGDSDLGIYESPVFLSRIVASVHPNVGASERVPLAQAFPTQSHESLEDQDFTSAVPECGANDPSTPKLALESFEVPDFTSATPECGANDPSTPKLALESFEVPDFTSATPECGANDPSTPKLALESFEGAALMAPPVSPITRENVPWERWEQELRAADGPRPLGAVERLFQEAFVPLGLAWLRGNAPQRVRKVLDDWSSSFAQSYADSFCAFSARGKRPQMVLDIPSISLRLARLHAARSVQLVLVDGLRFDLGQLIEMRLMQRLANRAVLAERLLLWSALPSTTETQLRLLERGPDSLRDTSVPDELPALVAKGTAATQPRRLHVGRRDVLKLDLVEARLAEPGSFGAEDLELLADQVTESLGRTLESLPERTLVMVFGDHGFLTHPVPRSGGASPEEVLVPAQAWMIGMPQ